MKSATHSIQLVDSFVRCKNFFSRVVRGVLGEDNGRVFRIGGYRELEIVGDAIGVSVSEEDLELSRAAAESRQLVLAQDGGLNWMDSRVAKCWVCGVS